MSRRNARVLGMAGMAGMAGKPGMAGIVGIAAPVCLLAVLSLLLFRPAAAQEGFPDLVAGLKQTPGCLGVDVGGMDSGKQVIFAWFENKEALMKWYYSEMHQGVMQSFFPARAAAGRKPMEGVADDIPIMAIASITFAEEGSIDETTLPISQIAIELYTPVTGGVYSGGRFAPDALQVKGLLSLESE